jgi:stearoyl-CoA desaturase (delta-9 desaturase)
VTRAHRIGNVLGILLPAAGLLLAIVLLWGSLVGIEALAITAAMYFLTGGLGISVGFHRLFSHRSYEVVRPVRFALAALGTMAMMGPIVRWVTNHRKHHAYTDEEGDPHSPHVSRGSGIRGAISGLWHAHVGWIFTDERASPERYARDLIADPVVMFVQRTSALWVALGLALPFAAGWAIGGTLEAALIALLWGGAVRIFLVHHVTFSINSLCHFAGRRRFDTEDESRNLGWLAALSFGECWHNNHHAFPTSPFHGLRRRELDPGRAVIRAMERLGLAWNVKRVTPDRQQARLESSVR